MDLKKLKEPFPKERISWRAQTVSKDGTKALALAYIDARDVMERLDEVCGPSRWQCRYTHADKKTVCDIGIFCTYESSVGGEWVWKADGAGDSDIEAEKGALSDAFKRAAVRWGIGRYLYELDSPWVPCESREFNGKKQFVKFTDDPWNHIRGLKPQASVPPAKPLTPDEKAAAWVGGARKAISAMQTQVQYKEWKEANKPALAKLASDYPDKFEELNVFIDGIYDNLAENF